MTFLNPIGWLFLSLAPVLVLLYLRRVHRRAVPVSTLLFWHRAMGAKRNRAWFGKLRRWYSLLFHLLILLLLVLALVRPELGRSGKGVLSAQSTVIVIDGRARMQALEPDNKSRFTKALQLARQTAAMAQTNSTVAVLVARPVPEVVSPFSTDPAVLATRLEKLEATDAGGNLAPALALARELVATRPGSHRILLITDSTPSLPADDVEIASVGSPLDNTAITRFATRLQIASPQTADLLLEVANFGRKPVRGNVEISCDGKLLDVKPFELGPGKRKSDVFPALPTRGNGPGRLTAHLDVSDALALDNTAYAILPTDDPCRVLLVSKGNWFLEKLLAADPSIHFDLLAPDAFQPAMARNFDAVVYDNCSEECGLKELDAVAGNALFIKSSPLGSIGTLDQPPVSDTDADSPLLRFVQWRDVNLVHALQLAPPQHEGWTFQTPIRSVDHPLIVAGTRSSQTGGSRQEQRLTVLAFDVVDSDLPLRVAFPLLISNTLHWLAGTNSELTGAVECGQPVDLAPGESATAKPESGAVTPAAGESTAAGSLQPMRNGFYRVDSREGSTESHRWLAVNTFSNDESNLATASGVPAPHQANRIIAFSQAATGSLWQWLTLSALLLLTLEWWLFHRRRTE